MECQEAINYLNNLEPGMFLIINIPILNDKVPITAMYMGKDEDGRYNLIDTSRFILTKDFIERSNISIEKEYDKDKIYDIYAKVQIMKKKEMKNKQTKSR